MIDAEIKKLMMQAMEKARNERANPKDNKKAARAMREMADRVESGKARASAFYYDFDDDGHHGMMAHMMDHVSLCVMVDKMFDEERRETLQIAIAGIAAREEKFMEELLKKLKIVMDNKDEIMEMMD